MDFLNMIDGFHAQNIHTLLAIGGLVGVGLFVRSIFNATSSPTQQPQQRRASDRA